jgi:multidrug efflux pump
VINPGETTPVYIRDVATVKFGVKDRETISRLNGQDAVTLSVKKRSGENIIRIAGDVRRVLERLTPTLPPDTEIHIVGDVSEIIQDMVSELENNILSGLILVVAVLFLFLGLMNSLFVATAIPFSMLMTFILLRAYDVTLNMVVLFSLILALGMLVDNAIVIVENIYRHQGQGKSPGVAARVGTSQVAGAVIASTLTTVCAFAPLLFWPGIMGEFMKYLPITVITTLTASLIVAMVFNPVLCARFMSPPRPQTGRPRLGERLMNFGINTYEPTLRFALRHRFGVLAGMTILLAAVFVLFKQFNAGVELFPDVDPTIAYVKIEAPSGTRIEVSDEYARRVEDEVAKVGDLMAHTTEVGAAGGNGLASAGSSSNQSVVTMEFIKKEFRRRSSRVELEDLRQRLRGFTGARVTVEKQEEGPPTGKPVNIEIAGDDYEVLGDLAADVKERIRGLSGLVDIQDNYDRALPEIEILPDVEKAGRYGLQTWDIASTVRTALQGFETAKYRVGEDEYDIVVRYRQPFRRKVEDLKQMTVFYEGESIPLSAFAEARFTTSLAAVHRINARRVVTVSADVATGFNGNALLKQVREDLRDFPLPPGYDIDYTGENEMQEESQKFLSEALAVAIMLIFVVLISQFSSVTVPLVILSSVVLSLIGVLLGLLLTGTAFGIIMTGVGVISLAGIVVNNAIVLLTYVIQLRERGMEKYEAIIKAGTTRFRPVILTAVTTILGLIPLTTGFSIDFERLVSGDIAHAVIIGGESSQWWGPMGVAVIWGLTVATFLTLVVVPVMYASLDPIKQTLHALLISSWWRRLRRV